MVVTLEPCCPRGTHGSLRRGDRRGRRARVIVGTIDPDSRVSGQGVELLKRLRRGRRGRRRRSGGACATRAVYMAPRRPVGPTWCLRSRAPSTASSRWLTARASGSPAKRRAATRTCCAPQSQAIIVGAGTVRSDDPALTARLGDLVFEPLRVVLGTAPEGAQVRPVPRASGDLGRSSTNSATTTCSSSSSKAGRRPPARSSRPGWSTTWCGTSRPSFAGSDGTLGALEDLSTPTIAALRRGRIVGVVRIGEDIRIDVEV